MRVKGFGNTKYFNSKNNEPNLALLTNSGKYNQ